MATYQIKKHYGTRRRFKARGYNVYESTDNKTWHLFTIARSAERAREIVNELN